MRKSVFALALVATIYAALAFYVLPQDAFFSSDEGLKLIQVQNFMRKGWTDFTLDYPGRWLDPELHFVPINNPPALIRDGNVYSVYPVFFPLLATPLFSLLGYAGLYVIPVLSGLVTLLLTWQLARLMDMRGVPAIVVLGLCTPLLFYSLLFWDHTLGTLLTTAALLLVVKTTSQPKWPLLLAAGAMLGLSVWARTELYVMAAIVPIAYFLLCGRRPLSTLILGLGTLMTLLPLWLFQLIVYGNPIGPHVAHFASLGYELPVTTNRLAILYYTLLESNSEPLLTFLFAMAFVASTTVLWRPKLRENRFLVAASFGALVLCSIPNLLQAWSGRPLGGLIATTPFLAFSFHSISNRDVEDAHRVLLGVCLGYVAVVCIATPVDPGLQWGPRFLLPIFPLATVLALRNYLSLAAAARRASSATVLTVCLAATLGISLLFQGCGIRVMQIVKSRDRQLIENISLLDSTRIISDEYGLAQYAAPLFYENQFFYVRSQEEYQRLTEVFAHNGIRRYAFVTYPVPHRGVVDPIVVSEGYVARQVGHQLFEIAARETGR
jgi:hypothetical protein